MMPCWSALESSVQFGKVQPHLVAGAARAAGWHVEISADGRVIRLIEAGSDILRGSVTIDASGVLRFQVGSRPLSWAGRTFDVRTDAGREAFASALKQAVAAHAVKLAAARAGWQITPLSSTRVALRKGR
jgi:hypothetical protein